jgi:hypothetical protein
VKETFLRRSSIAPCNSPKQLPLEFRKLGTVGIENVVIRREINKIIPRVLRIRVTKPLGEKFVVLARAGPAGSFGGVVQNGFNEEQWFRCKKFPLAQLIISLYSVRESEQVKRRCWKNGDGVGCEALALNEESITQGICDQKGS